MGMRTPQSVPGKCHVERLGRRQRPPNPVTADRRVAGARISSVFLGAIPGRSRLALLGRQRGTDRIFRSG